jgi:hypothetical protein
MWNPFLAVIPDEWVVSGLGVAFGALGVTIRTLYKDLAKKGERTGDIISRLTKAVEDLTAELRRR